jgi:transcriptional regulator with GAF, ATPase, and Fis domain
MEYYRSALRSGAELSNVPTESVARLHRKLADCFLQQGLPSEAARELGRAERLLPDSAGLAHAVLRVRRALVCFRQGRYRKAQALAMEGFRELATSDRHREVGNAQMILGNCAMRLGRLEKADEFFQDALATFRRVDLPLGQAQALINLATLAKNECRWASALQLFSKAEAIVRDRGHSHELAVLHNSMAVLYRKMGRRAEAMAQVERGLELGRNLGDQSRLTRLRLLKGQILVDEGRFAEAEQNLLEARVLAERRQTGRDLALADEFLGDLMAAQERFEEAELNYRLAEKRAQAMGPATDIQAEVLRRRAELALRQGDSSRALSLANQGIRIAEACGERFELPFFERVIGLALAGRGEYQPARDALESALARVSEYRLPVQMRRILRDLAHLHMRQEGRESLLLARTRLREVSEIADENSEYSPCQVQLDLARVELNLGEFDEALLALYELERLSCMGSHDELARDVQALRSEIEDALSQDAEDISSHYQALADLPELLDGDKPDAERNLRTMLLALADRLAADRAFLAIQEGDDVPRILSSHHLPRGRAAGLARHVLSLLDAASGPRVWTNPQADAAWSELGAEELREIQTAAALSLGRSGTLQALMYFDCQPRKRARRGFNNEALAVAASYVELLRAPIFDLARGGRADTGNRAFLLEEAFENIITESDAMVEVLRLCAKVAPTPYSVLFTGETGTGKGLLAYAVHRFSPRGQKRFVSLNCAAIPESLLESELFGHVKGAFTGASRTYKGLIPSADGGTLFLDEIGKMSLPMQAKLLHFLDSKEVRPVGGGESQIVDVRVLSASMRDLKEMVRQDLFLEDLYYRLLDFPIDVPPLRDRADDILLLARHYLDRVCGELGRPIPQMTRGFASGLRSYSWPGNVRELEKVIRRAVILSVGDDRLQAKDLPDSCRGKYAAEGEDQSVDPIQPLKDEVAEFEKVLLERALTSCGWNRSEAARRLKISYPTMLQKIKRYGLRIPN